jgi:hypothetical protein
MNTTPLVHHRWQSHAILGACERSAHDIAPSRALESMFSAIVEVAIACGNDSATLSGLPAAWQRVRDTSSRCMAQTVKQVDNPQSPSISIDFRELLLANRIVDLTAQLILQDLGYDLTEFPSALFDEWRSTVGEFDTEYKLPPPSEERAQELWTASAWLRSIRAFTQTNEILFATRYIIRFGDNEVDAPPQSRRLVIFFRSTFNAPKVLVTGLVIEESIYGRVFVDDGRQIYFLGEQEPCYLDWLERNGLTPDQEFPFLLERNEADRWAFGPLRKST